ALSLVVSYYNKKENTYLYLLHAPLNPNRFFHNPLLNNKLLQALGENNYLKTKELYIDKELDTKEFLNVSASYKEVFANNIYPDFDNSDIIFKDFKEAWIKNTDVDFNTLKLQLKPFNLHYLLNNKENRAYIEAVYYAFKITNDELVTGIVECTKDKILDLKKLNKYCEHINEFKKYNQELSLVYLDNKNANNKYQRYSVVAFISKFHKETRLDNIVFDIEMIMKENNLSSDVCNVLLEFMILENGSINLNYFRKIAFDFKRRGIINLEMAIKHLNSVKEYRTNPQPKNNNTNYGKTVIGSTDDWYQDEDDHKMSDEELAEIKAMMETW
ncbi:MAG: DnaD domain protein, partial [Bacilli bacterium]|nr:DnaD domain protein [Bacilli bacterium]